MQPALPAPASSWGGASGRLPAPVPTPGTTRRSFGLTERAAHATIGRTMDASARRVHAERARRRLPRQLRSRKITAPIAGLVGTAGVAAAALAVALMGMAAPRPSGEAA